MTAEKLPALPERPDEYEVNVFGKNPECKFQIRYLKGPETCGIDVVDTDGNVIARHIVEADEFKETVGKMYELSLQHSHKPGDNAVTLHLVTDEWDGSSISFHWRDDVVEAWVSGPGRKAEKVWGASAVDFSKFVTHIIGVYICNAQWHSCEEFAGMLTQRISDGLPIVWTVGYICQCGEMVLMGYDFTSKRSSTTAEIAARRLRLTSEAVSRRS